MDKGKKYYAKCNFFHYVVCSWVVMVRNTFLYSGIAIVTHCCIFEIVTSVCHVYNLTIVPRLH